MKTKRNLIQACLLGAILLQALNSGAQPVTKIAAGYHHSLFLKGDGSLWAMGDNSWGQLGDGTTNGGIYETNLPEMIVASNVTAVAGGWDHSLLLKSNGSLWGMGYNAWGALGDGATVNYLDSHTNVPEQIVASNVTAIAGGDYHSLFLKSDGSLWAMGLNQHGQLGDGGIDDLTNNPEQIVASDVTAIAAGQGFSLFLKSDGSLWAMGNNFYGQLGDGTGAYNISTNLPEEIVASNVTAIAAGGGHSLFLKSDGSLWAMGLNQHGQLGDGTYNSTNLPEEIVASNVTAIAAGVLHSLFLKSNGSLWAMGFNGYGELSDGTTDSGNYETNLPEEIVAGNVTAIAAGGEHSLFLKSDGSLWAMGDDYNGELGDGTYYNPPDPPFGVNLPELIVAGPAGFNQISVQLVSGNNVSLHYIGMAGTNYVLERSFSLSPATWVPLVTNPADAGGVLLLTNVPNKATNNFWRIRSVP